MSTCLQVDKQTQPEEKLQLGSVSIISSSLILFRNRRYIIHFTPERIEDVLLKSRMREIFTSGSVRGLIVTLGLLPQQKVGYGLYSTERVNTLCSLWTLWLIFLAINHFSSNKIILHLLTRVRNKGYNINNFIYLEAVKKFGVGTIANWTRIGRIYTDFPLSVRIRCIRAIRVPSRFIFSFQNLLIGFNTKIFDTHFI